MLFIEEPVSLKQALIALPLNNNRDTLTLSYFDGKPLFNLDTVENPRRSACASLPIRLHPYRL